MSGFIGGGGGGGAPIVDKNYYHDLIVTLAGSSSVAGYWNMIDSDGSDYGSNGNDMTATNGPIAYTTTNLLDAADLVAASSEYFTIADGAWDNGITSGFTTWAVANSDSLAAAQMLIAKRAYDATFADTLEAFQFLLNTNGSAEFFVYDNSQSIANSVTTRIQVITDASTVTTGDWFFIAGRYIPSAADETDLVIRIYKLIDLTYSADISGGEVGVFNNMDEVAAPTEIGCFFNAGTASRALFFDGEIIAGLTTKQMTDAEIAAMAQIYKEMLNI